MSDILPVILCGGGGQRLWPLSRPAMPKQFLPLVDGSSLFQQAVARVRGTPFAAPLVMASQACRFIAAEQLAQIGMKPAALLVEPGVRDTAPAVLAAALWAMRQHGEDVLLLVSPSDHLITDTSAFRQAVLQGVAAARAGWLVTFGVRPDRPETGYGYLLLANDAADDAADTAVRVRRFVEKPDARTAEELLQYENVLWNAGLFLFAAGAVVSAFRQHAPDLIGPVHAAVQRAARDLHFLRLEATSWAQARRVSLDRAVMEKAGNVVAVPLRGTWSDLGDWAAVWRTRDKDAQDNALCGEATALECAGSLLWADEGMRVAGLGLRDVLVVATGDAVLVADKARAQQVRDLVQAMQAAGLKQAMQPRRVHRPWGWFETICAGKGFRVKRLQIRPGGRLSLQKHQHRAEHWVVVAGEVRALIGEVEHMLGANQSAYVPQGEVHRLENASTEPVEIIEVQTGPYLGEDDIIRLDDVHAQR